MNVRTPYHQLPITLINKAVKQKVYRQLHCLECGRVIADITDKIVSVYDGNVLIESLLPDEIGIVEIHCQNHICKQYYQLEFSR